MYHRPSDYPPNASRGLEPARSFPGLGTAENRGTAPARARGLTIVELLVVFVIIAILASSILVLSSTAVNKAKVSNTQAMLAVVRDAVEQFRREQEEKPGVSKLDSYRMRYGRFPPDELEAFTSVGFPGGPPRSLGVGGARVVPSPPPDFGPMKFYSRGLSPDEKALEHRDLAAMLAAIEMFGDASGVMLDQIQDRYRTPGPLLPDGKTPALFIDRPSAETGRPNGKWDAGDLQIRYIVDDWGMPISYLTQRDWDPENHDAEAALSTNHPAWNQASTQMVRINGGQPIIMSYGLNGPEQLTRDQMEVAGTKGGAASLVVDFVDDGKINHRLNEDNVFPDAALMPKLAKGVAP